MVFERINKRKKQALEALVNGLHEQAIQEFGAVAKMEIHLAEMSKDPRFVDVLIKHFEKGLLDESDIYKATIKHLKSVPKEQPATKSNGSVAEPVKRWAPITDVDFTFADVIGLDDVIKEIKGILIDTHKNPAVAKKYGLKTGEGMLLYGPPGTGKTSLARAVAGELSHIPFFNIDCNDVLERSPQKTVANIRSIFSEVRKYERSVLFFDEIEMLLPPYSQSSNKEQAVSSFLVELDGTEKRKNNFLLMGASNRPWKIRPAMLRSDRFDNLVYVDFPTASVREAMFKYFLDPVKKAGVLSDDVMYTTLANMTDGYTGADIKGICKIAGRICWNYFTETGNQRKMTMSDLSTAVDKKNRTPKKKYDVEAMERFRKGE